MTTIRDVARLAGVSPAAASMALNNHPRISNITKEKVIKASKEINYIPNSIAKSLTTKKTGMIGLMLAEIINPYHATLTHLIKNELDQKGYRLSLGISRGSQKLEQDVVKDFISQRVEGVLIHAVDNINFQLSTIYELIRRNIPTVLIGGNFDGINLPYIDVNLELGCYLLTKYLIEKKYQRFLILSGLMNAATFKRRLEGINKAIIEAAYKITCKDVVETNPDFFGGYESIIKILEKKHLDYDVIICGNDYMAYGVLKALKEYDINVPQEVGVTGFDDIFFSSVTSVPLTSVHVPIEELAQKSVQILYKIIKENIKIDSLSNLVDEVFPTLAIREST